MTFLKRTPLHPLFFSMNPILALLASNIVEVDVGVVIRPLLISILFSIIIFLVSYTIFKDPHKSALFTTFFLILFFTYGHVYQIIEQEEILGVNIGRHRYLIPFYIAIGSSGMWLIVKRVKDFIYTTQVLNIIGAFLLVVPIIQILFFSVRISKGENAAVELKETLPQSDLHLPEELPDIYYVILDTYTRGDALQRDFNFDNSYFLNGLRELGFYVAGCSRSNYSYTQGTITAALNMDYLPALGDDLEELGLGSGDIWVLMKQSLVRRKLEGIGYQTVAFETGYEWSRLRDADFYFGIGSNAYELQMTSPFESMVMKSTALIILLESPSWWMSEQMKAINFPYGSYVQTQQSVLDQLPQLPMLEGPKFVFVHILIPHVPYVFDPDGNIREDPGYFSGKLAGPINDQYMLDGYTGEIQFINSKVLEIVEQLIEKSEPDPIIIIHGDHGLEGENRLQIFNTYYLPDDGNSLLYPSISPVNSFRVVFDTIFGTDYGLLVDESFLGDDKNPVPEYSPECP